MTPPRTALLAGATGLIGRELLAQLLAHPAYARAVAAAMIAALLEARPGLRLLASAEMQPAPGR